jgi:membrane protease YdiL (CAAX protease family)
MSEGSFPARSGGRLAGWLALIGLLAALNYSSRFAAEPERDVLYTWAAFAGALFQFSLMLVLVLVIARGAARELFALRRPRRIGVAVGLAFGVYVGTMVLAGVLEPLLDAGDEQGLVPEGWDPSRAAPFVANFVVISTFVPVVEELTFRGVGFSLLAARLARPAAIVSIGLLFGVAHGLVRALPILVAFGIGLAWLRSRTESVYPCIVLHGFFNAVALIAAVTLGDDIEQ